MQRIRITLTLLSALALATSAGCKSKEKKAGDGTAEKKSADNADTGHGQAGDTTPDDGDKGDEAGAADGGSEESGTLHGEEVKYQAGDTTMVGYLVYDRAVEGKRPGVLVVHEWWGHNDYARERARKLARLGYTALAVDMYGDGKTADHPDDAQKFSNEVAENLEQGVARFEAARKLLADHETTDSEKIGAIGYCFGGGVVLHMARIGADLDVVASFHGRLKPMAPGKKGEVKARILAYHGEADPFVPAEDIEAFKNEMKELGASFEFVAYPGAKHSFTNPGATEIGAKFKLPLEYDEAADRASWESMTEEFEKAFGDS